LQFDSFFREPIDIWGSCNTTVQPNVAPTKVIGKQNKNVGSRLNFACDGADLTCQRDAGHDRRQREIDRYHAMVVRVRSDCESRGLARRILRFLTTLNCVNQVSPPHARSIALGNRAGVRRVRVSIPC